MKQIAHFLSNRPKGKDLYDGQSQYIVADLATKEEKATEEGNRDKMKIVKQCIDSIVYQLYGLTYYEVLIIDPDLPITREEYETKYK